MRRFAAAATGLVALTKYKRIYAQEQEQQPFELDKAFASVDWDAVRTAVTAGEPIPNEQVSSFPKNPYCEFCMSSCGQQYVAFVLACELEKRDGLESGSACHPYFETFAKCLMEDPEYSHHFKPKPAEEIATATESETAAETATATETVESQVQHDTRK
jgi:hypothetical protein